MCTAISMQNGDHYFGRNLDLEYSYNEQIVITPRRFPFVFRKREKMTQHYAMIGMAFVQGDYPLYYEAVNEKGLGMAGLNFPGNGVYLACRPDRENVAPFELIPRVLGECAGLEQAVRLLQQINIVDLHFSPQLPNTPLHWLVADQSGSLVVEQTCDGLHLYRNPVGVLTNNPTFGWHMTNLCNYMGVGAAQPQNCFAPQLELAPFSRGMGSLALPGGFSSQSRFVQAAFVLHNTLPEQEERGEGSPVFSYSFFGGYAPWLHKNPRGKRPVHPLQLLLQHHKRHLLLHHL